MKILLIAINAKYIHSNPAVYSLKACAGEYESYVDVAEYTINQKPSYILREIYKRHPDVAAFSCYIWNRTMVAELIHDLHKIIPDIQIWAGGPEVSYDAMQVIREWDLQGVMSGYGEGSFYHLVSSYVNGISESLPSVLDGNQIPCIKLDDIPFWYQSVNENSIHVEDFSNRIIYYESSRGCPFSCSYCLSSIEKKMDFRSVEQVCRHLKYFIQQNVVQVKFVDRTFNCKKDHALPILQYILENDNGITNFHFEIAADLLDEDYFVLLEKMRPGAVQFEIGVQSTHGRTIDAINRKMDFDKVADVVRRISSWNNIHIHLDLIAGLPYEDIDTFRRSFNDVYALSPEQLQLGFLKVLKGSAMETLAPEYDLVYTSLPPYEVLATKWLSYEDICHLKLIEEVLEIYYNSGQFRNTLQYLCSFFDTPYDLYEQLAFWYEAHDLFGVQPSRIRKYDVLMEFGSAWIDRQVTAEDFFSVDHKKYVFQKTCDMVHMKQEKEELRLRECLTYDLYLRENMKNRPSFAPSLERWKDRIYQMLYKESQDHLLFPQLSGHHYRELTKALHVEIFEAIFEEPVMIIFCYDRKDSVTNNCMVACVPVYMEQ